MNQIIRREIDSTLQSREGAFIICRDGTVHDQGSTGKWNDITVPGFDPVKACNGNDSIVFHTHVVSSSVPSSRDVKSYFKQFRLHPSLKKGCSVGVDGIYCIGRDGKHEMKKFTPAQETYFLNMSGVTRWEGDQVFCDKLVDGEKPFHACFLQDTEKMERPIGIFKEVSFHGGSVWTGDEQADISMFSSLPSSRIECFGSRGGKMQLSCIIITDRSGR